MPPRLQRISIPRYLYASTFARLQPASIPPYLLVSTLQRAPRALEANTSASLRLATAPRACCRLQSFLLPRKLDSQDREQDLDLKQGQHALNRPASRLAGAENL